MIIELIFIWFFTGILYGIMDAWNKKVAFFVWLASIIYSIIVLSLNTDGLDISSLGISNFWYLLLFLFMLFGMFIGKRVYNIVFNKEYY